MDVDGTLTDGKIHISENGELFKAFNIKDGLAITLLKSDSIIPVIITGRVSKITEIRCKELGINEIHQGVNDKLSVLQSILKRYRFDKESALYFGDDVNDIECMKYCKFSACPADSVDEVKINVNYICKRNGGEGALRDLLENFIKC